MEPGEPRPPVVYFEHQPVDGYPGPGDLHVSGTGWGASQGYSHTNHNLGQRPSILWAT